MAIITPLKKLFKWETAHERIPYQVYTAYVTVDDSENMYASKVLQNTIGTVKFQNGVGTGVWRIVLPYEVPRCNIAMPGFGNWWSSANSGMISTNGKDIYSFTMTPGYHPTSNDPINSLTDNVEIYTRIQDGTNTGGNVTWKSAFAQPAQNAPFTSVLIEIRVYN